jgi:hypothetical protein
MARTKNVKKVTVKSKKTSKSKATLTPFNETEWRIREDAETLKRAMAIKNDPTRLKAAKDYATKEMEALKKISKMK